MEKTVIFPIDLIQLPRNSAAGGEKVPSGHEKTASDLFKCGIPKKVSDNSSPAQHPATRYGRRIGEEGGS